MTSKRSIQLRLGLAALAAVATGLLAGPAAATPNGADLVTTITAPTGASVYQPARWGVTVRNTGNRDASNVTLTIQLPRTANSPTQYLMGTLGTVNGCTGSRLTLVCNLGTVGRRSLPTSTRSVSFDITLPYSTNPIVFSANAPLTGDLNPSDNQTSATATLATRTVPFTATRTILNTHCTGSSALSSFIECVAGSTSSFTAELLPGSTATSGPVYVAANGVGGTWTVNGSQLTIEYTDGPDVVATFVGQGVSDTCWEGRTSFPGTTQYISIFQVCLQ